MRSARATLPAALILPLILALAAGCSDRGPAGLDEPLCSSLPPEPGTGPGPADLAGRELPGWYDDAKLGIMIHWGPFAIPAWAERTLDPEVIFTDPTSPDYFLTLHGVERFLQHNPYSEWYWNSMSIEGSGARAHHREVWGEDFSYERFGSLFGDQIAGWQPAEWARLFRSAGARYVVLVTKHHDGYVLWPSDVPNPNRSGWQAPRDVVGELAGAVREQCLRMGVYYSGGIDWTFAPPPFATALDALRLTPSQPGYASYVDAQWRELIARYRPSVLWNDIASPPANDREALFRDYLTTVPDGVVNDRWTNGSDDVHHDFTTAEFDVLDGISAEKWEAVRGMGRGFGFNQNDRAEDYGTAEKFIRLLVDVVSKNGNLLLNVGPRADGSIPAEQQAILTGLGEWLGRNGAAIYGTRPWQRFGGRTTDGIAVRFTRSTGDDTLYAILLGTPATEAVTIEDLPLEPARVRLLGEAGDLSWAALGDGLRVTLPAQLPAAAAHVLAIEAPRSRTGS